MIDGERAPRAGEVFRNPGLARTFRRLAEEGKDGFYKGPVADSIVQAVQAQGGVLTAEVGSVVPPCRQAIPHLTSPSLFAPQDLAAHRTSWPDPISASYGGVDVYEIPPNGQGLTALIALNVRRRGRGVLWEPAAALC